MFDLIKRLSDICLFKKGPQDLPPPLILLALLMTINLLVSYLILHMGNGIFRSILQAVTGLALEVGFSAACLFGFGKLARFNQTTSALLGTDALISFIALPVMATLLLGQGGLVTFLVMMALMIWHWAVIGHIMRHALNQHISFGLGLALLYLVATYHVMALLFPELTDVK